MALCRTKAFYGHIKTTLLIFILTFSIPEEKYMYFPIGIWKALPWTLKIKRGCRMQVNMTIGIKYDQVMQLQPN